MFPRINGRPCFTWILSRYFFNPPFLQTLKKPTNSDKLFRSATSQSNHQRLQRKHHFFYHQFQMGLFLARMLIRRKLQQQNVLGSPRFNNLEGSAVRTRVSPNYWELEDGLVISSLALLIYRVYHRLGSIWKSGHLTLMSKMATRSYLTSLWL